MLSKKNLIKTGLLITFFICSWSNLSATKSLTNSISIDNCNPESLRSKDLLLNLINLIKKEWNTETDYNAQVTIKSFIDGLTASCIIENPYVHIIVTTFNKSNKIHCTIVSQMFTKKQSLCIKETMKKLFCDIE